MNKSTSLNKLCCVVGIIALLLLEIAYINNTVNEILMSTGRLQIIISVFAIIPMCLALLKRINSVSLIGIFMTLIMLNSGIIMSSGNISIVSLVIKLTLWLSVFFLGYAFSFLNEKNDVLVKYVMVAFIVMTGIYISSLYSDYSIENKDYVLTSVYYLICCFPFTFLIKNHNIKQVAQGAIVLLTVLSFKRSALIVLATSIICTMFSKDKSQQREKKNKFILFSLIFLVLFVFIIKSQTSNLSFNILWGVWNDRFSNSTARFSIYADVFEMLKKSSFLEIIFGHGNNAVMKNSISGLSAHNDYLEILYDYGLIAFLLFILFIIELFKIRKHIKTLTTNEHYKGYICSLVIFVVASMPSHMLTYSTYFLFLSLYWGYTIGICYKNTYKEGSKGKNEGRNINLS